MILLSSQGRSGGSNGFVSLAPASWQEQGAVHSPPCWEIRLFFISLPFPSAFRRFCGVQELLWGSLSVGNVSLHHRETERCPACEIPPTSKGGRVGVKPHPSPDG